MLANKFKNLIIFISIAFLVLFFVKILSLSLKEKRGRQNYPVKSPEISKNQSSQKYQFFSGGEYDYSLQHDGLTRKYKVYIPSDYNPTKPTPLVMVFHGGGGNMDRAPHYFGFNKLADQENFIVVYPEGTGTRIVGNLLGTWNGGDCCGPAYDNNVDDVGFIKKMLAKIESEFNVDKKRIFATGMSNGAIMTYRLACEMSDQIAAIAPVASVGHYKKCQPSRPVATLHIHGLNDPCAPYNGCEKCQSCIQTYLSKLGLKVKTRPSHSLPVPKFINNWKNLNHCSDKTKSVYQSKDADCFEYLNCAKNSTVELCSIKNLGHTWPGRTSYGTDACQKNPHGHLCNLWKETVGPLNKNFPANKIIWKFFTEHPLN